MRKTAHRPTALTIAGSDSGGGAGIQADLKTFAAFGVHGASAITCLTAQNPNRVLAIEPCSPRMLRRQMEAVFEELHPTAVKTGMLYTAENIHTVANFFRTANSELRTPAARRSASARRRPKLVVDPVMISTSGTVLLRPPAIKILKERLLPLATIVTPNLAEAEAITGEKVATLENMRAAARTIHKRYGCAALVKGGHLKGIRQAADIFFDGRMELLLTAPFIKGIRTHGTGCTYSAAVTAVLATGRPLSDAVTLAKKYITQAIARSFHAGNHPVLSHFFH